ncbi:MAG: Abi family protein [Deltaproteobacteria bacterium]|nr:Abi family protein [Deltaproteobacteria bacterium]
MKFQKPPKTFDEQVGLLISRGMRIDDTKRAERYLSHLNYYRLAAYWLPYEKDHTTHRFRLDTTFDLILQHYIFDRKLRLLIMDAIERIEVSLRTRWAYHLSHAYGPHALLEPKVFNSKWSHAKNVDALKHTVQSSSEVFIRHFDQYEEDLPPVWVSCEIMTLGQLSKWTKNLRRRKDRNAIARTYGMDEKNLTSFLHHLTIVRNHCAHHARIWNREFVFLLRLPRKKPPGLYQNFNTTDGRRIYNTFVMLAYLMDQLGPNSWKMRLYNLLREHPNVAPRTMGFPADWLGRPIWIGITS